MLRLHTLGSFELAQGEPPAVRLVPAQPKRLALVAFLALATPRGFHRRDTLLALFWPELSDEEARRALRQALHHLRRAVGEEAIETRPDDQVRLRPGQLWCDAVAMEEAVSAGRYEEALALFRNEFLAGVHLPEVSPELEEWIEQTRARLHRLAGQAAAAVADRAEAGGDLARAIEAARAAGLLDPDDEPAARRLIRLLDRSGDRAGALQVYDRLARRLESEYQTVPSAETEALVRTLREPPAIAAAAGGAPTGADASEASPFRRWIPAAVAAALAAVAVLAAIWPRSEPTLLSTGRLQPSDRVLVADFENHSRDSVLAGVVTAALRLELSQSPLVRVLSAPEAQASRRRMGDPDPTAPLGDSVAQLLAAREGLDLIVRGNVSSVGPGWVISAQLVEPATGGPLATVRETAADSLRLLEAIDGLGRELRERLGESARAVRASPPLRKVTTGSLPALRRWSQAQAALDRGDRETARRLYEDAVALDSTFAMAWRALSVLYGSLGPPDAMADAAARGYRHRDRLTDRERHLVTAQYHIAVTGDFGRAFAAFDSQLAVTPNDPGIAGSAAYLHFRLREFDQAEALYRRSVRFDSTLTPVYYGLIESLINLGRLDDARAALDLFRRRFPDNLFSEWEEIYLAVGAGRLDSAEAHARRLLALAPDDADHRGEAISNLASLALLNGRASESERLRREGMRVYEADGDMRGYFSEALNCAFGLAALGRPDRAQVVVAEAMRRHPLDSLPPGARPYVRLGILYAGLGDPERAAEMQAAVESQGLNRGRFAEAEWHRLRGAVLLARGRSLEAQAELRRAAAADECALCSLPLLGRSYELGGRVDSAIAVYERYLRTPWMKRVELDALERRGLVARLDALYRVRDGQVGDGRQ